SSYFQGSSILHFSLVIGLFLSFMGVGSYFSRYIKTDLLQWFIRFEIILGIVGGFATFLLYFAFSLTPYFYLVAFILIGILGGLIGVEIPILTRIVREYENLRDALAQVLSFDYMGALVASVLFPIILLPNLGTMRTSFIVGLLNLVVAGLNIYLFRAELPRFRSLMGTTIVSGMILIGGFFYSFQLNSFFEQFLYQDQVMLSRQSAYQQIIMTKWNQDIRLFIDGNIQFSSRDEHRYHEPLVHIPMALSPSRERVLLLGAGDGLAVREVLKYPDVGVVEVVDLDPEMTQIGINHPVLIRLNDSAFHDPKVKVYNQDAYKFIEESSDFYDVVIIDLPDPNNHSLGKLYSAEFYGLLTKRMSMGGTVVTQSTSPYFAPDAFWCIHQTMESVLPHTLGYQTNVPSFGPWGFNMSQRLPVQEGEERWPQT
ncbi:MAG: polyamine aminopropyltransferase, partial [Bacteroidota bacterium]